MSQIMSVIGPIIVALVYISLCSLFGEPSRQNFNAIMIAGAGAAYLNGGFGIWEFAFTASVTFCAFRGLRSSNWIGVGWLLHTGWDVLHHVYGNPIVPFATDSSFGCAICDVSVARRPCTTCFAEGSSKNPTRHLETIRRDRDLYRLRHQQAGPSYFLKC